MVSFYSSPIVAGRVGHLRSKAKIVVRVSCIPDAAHAAQRRANSPLSNGPGSGVLPPKSGKFPTLSRSAHAPRLHAPAGNSASTAPCPRNDSSKRPVHSPAAHRAVAHERDDESNVHSHRRTDAHFPQLLFYSYVTLSISSPQMPGAREIAGDLARKSREDFEIPMTTINQGV